MKSFLAFFIVLFFLGMKGEGWNIHYFWSVTWDSLVVSVIFSVVCYGIWRISKAISWAAEQSDAEEAEKKKG